MSKVVIMGNNKERKYPPRHIPKTKLDEVILACVDGARTLVGCAAAIVRDHNYLASILLNFGIEEYGKAVWLKEYRNCTENIIEVDGAIFKDHTKKLQKARDNLPAEVLILKQAAFDPKAFQSDAFDTITAEVNLVTRLDQLFVDWDDEKGLNKKLHVDVGRVLESAKTVTERLMQLRDEIKA